MDDQAAENHKAGTRTVVQLPEVGSCVRVIPLTHDPGTGDRGM